MAKQRLKIPFVLGLLTVAPLLLGAKGCDAVVGNDRKPCGGLAGTPCADDQFCDFSREAMCGAADQTGVCRPIPEACTQELDPVCGCDDRTYGNACTANMAGVSVASEGECGGGSNACGGLTGARCEAGEFCDFPVSAMCGTADATGTCAPIPNACDTSLDPVCGCDGRTYSNACVANMAGVAVASRGECGGGGTGGTGNGGTGGGGTGGDDVCGGLRGAECPAEDFCNFPPDALCGFADATGVCEPKPEVCADIFAPVCGCDGRTYPNACEANGAGVSVASEGECTPTDPEFCGGIAGFGCPAGEFCNYPPEAMCGAADATGTCTPYPGACTTELAPVCGCDDVTYSNACVAAIAGVSVAHDGECR